MFLRVPSFHCVLVVLLQHTMLRFDFSVVSLHMKHEFLMEQCSLNERNEAPAPHEAVENLKLPTEIRSALSVCY